MRGPRDSSGAAFERDVEELYGGRGHLPEAVHRDTSGGGGDSPQRSDEDRARQAGFSSYEEYEDYCEDLSED